MWRCGYCGKTKSYTAFVLATPATVHKDINKHIIKAGHWRKCRRCVDAASNPPPQEAVTSTTQEIATLWCTQCQADLPRENFADQVDPKNAICNKHKGGSSFRATDTFECSKCHVKKPEKLFDKRTLHEERAATDNPKLVCIECTPSFFAKCSGKAFSCQACGKQRPFEEFRMSMKKRLEAGKRQVTCEDCECPLCATCKKRSTKPLARPLGKNEVYYCTEHQPKLELQLRCSKCGLKPVSAFTEAAQQFAAKHCKYGDKSNKNLCLVCIEERDFKDCLQCKARKHKDLFGRMKHRTIKSICLECDPEPPSCVVWGSQAEKTVKDLAADKPWYCILCNLGRRPTYARLPFPWFP